MDENIEPTEEELAFAGHQIKLGQAMERLSSNDDFKLVFLTGFIDDFAKTSMANMVNIGRDKRINIVEAQLARSYVIQYMDEVINDANIQIQVQREEELERQYEQQERNENQDNLEES